VTGEAGSMPASLEHVTPDAPMGAVLVAGGATFRVWARRRREPARARHQRR